MSEVIDRAAASAESTALLDRGLYPPIAAISRVRSAAIIERRSGQAGIPDRHLDLPAASASAVVASAGRTHSISGASLARREAASAAAPNLPFGTGPRTSIGSAFALQEATIVLANIAKHVTFELKPGHAVWPLLRATLRPANGLPMVVRRWTSAIGRGRLKA
jgi:hypothetical protein